jgi:hypothetical protein
MEFRFLLLPISLGLLLPSLLLPWLAVDFLGHHMYVPVNVLGEIMNQNNNNNNAITKQDDSFGLLDITSTYHDSWFAIVFSMVIYPASIILIVAAVLYRNYQSKLALAGGILAIISVILWIYAIDSFKSHFAREAASTGGLISGEWKGKENLLINRIIITGSGYYYVIIAGTIAISVYIIENFHYRKKPRAEAGVFKQ